MEKVSEAGSTQSDASISAAATKTFGAPDTPAWSAKDIESVDIQRSVNDQNSQPIVSSKIFRRRIAGLLRLCDGPMPGRWNGCDREKKLEKLETWIGRNLIDNQNGGTRIDQSLEGCDLTDNSDAAEALNLNWSLCSSHGSRWG